MGGSILLAAHFRRARKRYNGWTVFLEERKKMGNVTYEQFNAGMGLPYLAQYRGRLAAI